MIWWVHNTDNKSSRRMCVWRGEGGGLQIWGTIVLENSRTKFESKWAVSLGQWGGSHTLRWERKGRGRARMEMMTFVFKMIRIHQKERVQKLMSNKASLPRLRPLRRTGFAARPGDQHVEGWRGYLSSCSHEELPSWVSLCGHFRKPSPQALCLEIFGHLIVY